MTAQEFKLAMDEHKARLDRLEREMQELKFKMETQETLAEIFGQAGEVEVISESELKNMFAECNHMS